jgi:VanZ family protein
MKDEEDARRHSLHPSPFRLHPSSFLWRYGPVVVWTCVVLGASSPGLSSANTPRVIGPLLRWLFPGISETTLETVHFLVRKTSHFSEYALLALLAARAFHTSGRTALRRLWWLAAFALAACVALTDEYHQTFVPSRQGSIYDSLLDMAGAATALACAALWLRRRRRKAYDAERGG